MKIKNPRLKNYLRNRRGAASIEAALGTVVMVAASLLALDLYRLASTQTTIRARRCQLGRHRQPEGAARTHRERNYGGK